MPWTYVVSEHKDEEVVGPFHKKELHKTSLKKFRVEKVIKKVINYTLNGKVMVILLSVGLIKKA